MRRIVAILLLCFLILIPQPGSADHLVVGRTTAIRAEPRRDAERLSTVDPGATLSLEGSDLKNGYYQVTDPISAKPGWIYKTFVRRYPDDVKRASPPAQEPITGAIDCADAKPMRVRFYDVGQALAALIELPDGRRILVDAGESPTRAGCGGACQTKHEHLLNRLAADLDGKPLSALWITHQHSDHVGGALGVLENVAVQLYVDNGQALGKGQVKKARALALARGARVAAVEPVQRRSPLEGVGDALKIRAVLPASWPVDCEEDPNSCSVGLRVDYCASSVLFTGDAENDEEAAFDAFGPAVLLQVGHHGSGTSSSRHFLAKISPKYAVIASGKRGEGLNSTYCHPRTETIDSLRAVLGAPGGSPVLAFDGTVKCKAASDATWKNVASSEHLWVTARDGDVTLVTRGDGQFVRE